MVKPQEADGMRKATLAKGSALRVILKEQGTSTYFKFINNVRGLDVFTVLREIDWGWVAFIRFCGSVDFVVSGVGKRRDESASSARFGAAGW